MHNPASGVRVGLQLAYWPGTFLHSAGVRLLPPGEIQEANIATASSTNQRPRRSTWLTYVAWIVVCIVLASGVVAALHRGLQNRPDWDDLRTESAYVWQHGHTAPGTAMFGYLPATTFVLWPFTAWLPQPLGLSFFVASNLLAAIASVWIVRRWWMGLGGHAAWFVWPVLLVCANFQHALQANQLTLWTLLLCVAGLALVGRRRGFLGGSLVGLAAVIKIMPGILVLYLILRRRWRALGGVLVAGVVFDLVPSVVFFGWHGALQEHQAWLRRAAWHSNRQLIEQPLLRVHRHGTNSSLAGVLTRWLRALPAADRQVILYGDPPADVVARYQAALAPDECLTLDPMPPRDGTWSEKRVDIAWVPRFHVANLPASTVWWIWLNLIALGLAALLAVTCWSSGTAGWAPLSALWMLAMFWPSPMTRHYYLAWAFPALVIVWRALVAELERRNQRWSWTTRLAALALATWLLSVASLGSKLLGWYGVHLAVLAFLTIATLWACLRASDHALAGDPDASGGGGPLDQVRDRFVDGA